MSADQTDVTFYHSVICPRCFYSRRALQSVLRKHPGITVTPVEILTHRHQARTDGVTTIPALVSGGQVLTGVVLTPRRIERFLETSKRPSSGSRAGRDAAIAEPGDVLCRRAPEEP